MSYVTGGPYNDTTILRDGSGQKAGLIGEVAFATALAERGITYFHLVGDKKKHDFVVDGVKIDVKAKERNVPPSYDYDAHVTKSLRNADCRLYVFVNVTNDQPTIMGWYGKEEFWRDAKIVSNGEVDEDGKPERADAGKMKYRDLRPIDDLWGKLRKEAK